MCITRTPARWRSSAPPMCIRQEVSTAVHTSARVPSTSRSLSPSIAIEVSAFLTANVPPNPQHSAGCSSSTSSIPRTARSSRCGRSPILSARSEWHVGCSVTRCGNEAPTSSAPSTSTTNSVSSYSGGPSRNRSRTNPTHEALGDTTAPAPANTRPKRSSSGPASWPELPCICPQHVCSGRNSTSQPSRSSTATVARPAAGNSVSLKHVTNSATRIRGQA